MKRLALLVPLVLSGCAALASDPIDHVHLLDGTTLHGEIEGVSDGAFVLRVGDDDVRSVSLDDIDHVERNTIARLEVEKAPRVRPGFNIGLVGAAADVEVEVDKRGVHSAGVRAGLGLGLNGYAIISASGYPQISGYGAFYAQLITNKRFHIEGATGPSLLFSPGYSGVFLAWEGGVAAVVDLTDHVGLRGGLVGSAPMMQVAPYPAISSGFYVLGFRPESAVTFRW